MLDYEVTICFRADYVAKLTIRAENHDQADQMAQKVLDDEVSGLDSLQVLCDGKVELIDMECSIDSVEEL